MAEPLQLGGVSGVRISWWGDRRGVFELLLPPARISRSPANQRMAIVCKVKPSPIITSDCVPKGGPIACIAERRELEKAKHGVMIWWNLVSSSLV
jgi:hypothetical protein